MIWFCVVLTCVFWSAVVALRIWTDRAVSGRKRVLVTAVMLLCGYVVLLLAFAIFATFFRIVEILTAVS